MEDNNKDSGLEIITPDQGWGVDFEQSSDEPSSFWQDPFKDSGEVSGAAAAVDAAQEPLIERDLETPEEEAPVTDEAEVPEVDNPIYFLAKQAVADGLLPQDTDITEDIDLNSMYNSYKEYVAPAVERQIISEVEERLSKIGIREDNISLLQAIENGVPVDEIQQVTKFKKYSTLSEDIEEDQKKKVIQEWYSMRGLSDKEQKRNLDAIELDDEVDSEFSEAKSFFNNVSTQFDKEQQDIAQQKERQAIAVQQRNAQIVDRLNKDFVLGQEKLQKQDAQLILNSIYNKEKVDIGGQVYDLSPYEQFFISLNNDFEFSLAVFKDFLLKDKSASRIKKELVQEAENDWLSAYRKAQEKSSSKTSIKRNNNTKDSIVSSTTSTGGVYEEF